MREFNAIYRCRPTYLDLALWAYPCLTVTDLSDSAAYCSEEEHSRRFSNVRACTWISQGSKRILRYDFLHGQGLLLKIQKKYELFAY